MEAWRRMGPERGVDVARRLSPDRENSQFANCFLFVANPHHSRVV
jgi:hypothetical protein